MALRYTGRSRIVETTGTFTLFGRIGAWPGQVAFMALSEGSNTASELAGGVELFLSVTGTSPNRVYHYGVNWPGGSVELGSFLEGAPPLYVDFSASGSTRHYHPCKEVGEVTTDGIMSLYEVVDPDDEEWIDVTLDLSGGPVTHRTVIHPADPGAAPADRPLIAPVIGCTAGGVAFGDITIGATTVPGIGFTTEFTEQFDASTAPYMTGPLTDLEWEETVFTGAGGEYGSTVIPAPAPGARIEASGSAGGKSRQTVTARGAARQWGLPAQEDFDALVRFGRYTDTSLGVTIGITVPVTAEASAGGEFPDTSRVFGGYSLLYQVYYQPSGGANGQVALDTVNDYQADEINGEGFAGSPVGVYVLMDGETVANGPGRWWRGHDLTAAQDVLRVVQASSAPYAPLPYTVSTSTAETWIKDNFPDITTTATVGDGYLRLVSTAAAATYRGAYLNRPSSQGAVEDSGTYGVGTVRGHQMYAYRYFRVRFRCTSGDNKLLGVAASQNGLDGYLFLTSGLANEWVEREFDLADLPDFTTGPFTTSGLPAPRGFVPTRALLRFAIPGGTTFEIAEITGFRKYWTRLSVARPGAQNGRRATGADGMAMLHAFTDGIPSLQAMHLVDNVAGDTTYRTVTEVAAYINGLPASKGWSATVLTTDPDGVVDGSTYAIHLAGGGTLPDGTMTLDQDAASGTGYTIPAVPHAGELRFYYGAGDVFGTDDSAYGSTTPVRFVAQVGSQVVGQMLGDSASLVLTRDSDSADAGGVPEEADTRFFASDAPYLTNPSYTVDRGYTASTDPPGGIAIAAGSPTTFPVTMTAPSGGFGRWGQRRIIRFRNPYGDSLTGDISSTLRMMRGVVKGGQIVLQFAGNPDGSGAWASVSTGITGTQPVARYSRGRRGEPIVLAYIAGGGAIERRESYDEGGTWTVPLAVFSAGGRPTVAISPTGVEHYFMRTSGAAIQTRVFDPTGTQVVALTTVVASSVADDSIQAFWRNGTLYLLYRDTLGTIKTVKSVDGITFA